MKNIVSILLLSTALANAASSGPLQVGNFDPYVCQTATNKINTHYLPEAAKRNNNTSPSGSVAAMWQEIGKEGVAAYFKSHKDELKASAPYIERSNENEATTVSYKRAYDSASPTDIRALQWEAYALTAACVFGLLEKEIIPELNLKPISVIGIMEGNQGLTFTPEEKTSFGGAIAATISVMNLIYKADPAAFNKLYQKFLPKTSETHEA